MTAITLIKEKFNKRGKTVENLFLYLPQPTPRTSLLGQAHDHNQDKKWSSRTFATFCLQWVAVEREVERSWEAWKWLWVNWLGDQPPCQDISSSTCREFLKNKLWTDWLTSWQFKGSFGLLYFRRSFIHCESYKLSLRSADVVVVLIDVGVVVFVVATAAAAVVVVVQVCNELSLSPITNHLPTLVSWSRVRFVTVFSCIFF